MRTNQRARDLLVVFAIAALLRCGALLSPLNADVLFVDEGEYARYARNLVERGAYEAIWTTPPAFKAHRPPAFPAYLALHRLIAGERFATSAKLGNVVLGSLVPMLVYASIELLGLGAARRRAALTGGLVAAAYPYLILYGLLMLSELLYTLLASTTCYLLLRALAASDSPRLFAAAGFTAGLATLTRPSYALFPAFVASIGWLRGRPRTRRLASWSLFLAVLVCSVSPWLIRNAVALGRFPVLATNGGEPFWWGHHPDSRGYLPVFERTPAQQRDWRYAGRAPDELERSRRFYERAFRYIRADPARHVALGFAKLAYLWNLETREIPTWTHFGRFPPLGTLGDRIAAAATTAPFPLLTLAFLAALVFAPRSEHRFVLTGFVAYSSLVCMVFFGGSRFHLPFVPQLIICAAPVLGVGRAELTEHRRLTIFLALALLYLLVIWSFQIPEHPPAA